MLVIYEYQSTGTYNQNQLITSVNSRVSSRISLTAFYVFAHANSNTDGISTFPSSAYTIGSDYGRASNDIRNRFTLIGSILLKYGIRLSPTIMAQTGGPFNISVGDDLNGDLLLTDRPSLAPASACGTGNQYIKCTKFGDFNLRPTTSDALIPRNLRSRLPVASWPTCAPRKPGASAKPSAVRAVAAAAAVAVGCLPEWRWAAVVAVAAVVVVPAAVVAHAAVVVAVWAVVATLPTGATT